MSVENKAKRVAESKSVMTEMVMPNDANPMGNLMGGNLLDGWILSLVFVRENIVKTKWLLYL